MYRKRGQILTEILLLLVPATHNVENLEHVMFNFVGLGSLYTSVLVSSIQKKNPSFMPADFFLFSDTTGAGTSLGQTQMVKSETCVTQIFKSTVLGGRRRARGMTDGDQPTSNA